LTKHCPNPDCPHHRSTGRPAEYRDEADNCGDCRGELSPGAAPEVEPDESLLVTVATFSTPHEAHIARAALASHGIEGLVHQDHTPYLTSLPWVQLQVALRDAGLANEILERGPVHESTADGTAGPETQPTADDRIDDMRPARLRRRFALARWFLYAQALGGVMWVGGLFETPVLSLLAVLGAGIAFFTALHSKRQPRAAFAVALGLQTVMLGFTVALKGPFGLTALIPFLAVFNAWAAAAPEPPERLQESQLKLASPDVFIGDAWKETVAPDDTPGKPPHGPQKMRPSWR